MTTPAEPMPGEVRVLLCQVVRKETGEILSRHMELGDAKKAAGSRIDRGEPRPTVRTIFEWIRKDQLSSLYAALFQGLGKHELERQIRAGGEVAFHDSPTACSLLLIPDGRLVLMDVMVHIGYSAAIARAAATECPSPMLLASRLSEWYHGAISTTSQHPPTPSATPEVSEDGLQ